MARRLGRQRHVQVPGHPRPQGRLFDRHPAAHRLRFTACGACVLLHAHRRDRPVQAHARLRRVLSDGLGRQRPAHRAPCAELLRRARGHLAEVRSGFQAAVRGHRRQEDRRQGPGADQPPELHRAVREAHRAGREAVRGAVAQAGPVNRLVADLPHHRRASAARGAEGVPAQPEARRGLPEGGAGPVGRDVPDRRGPGRARIARVPGFLP